MFLNSEESKCNSHEPASKKAQPPVFVSLVFCSHTELSWMAWCKAQYSQWEAFHSPQSALEQAQDYHWAAQHIEKEGQFVVLLLSHSAHWRIGPNRGQTSVWFTPVSWWWMLLWNFIWALRTHQFLLTLNVLYGCHFCLTQGHLDMAFSRTFQCCSWIMQKSYWVTTPRCLKVKWYQGRDWEQHKILMTHVPSKVIYSHGKFVCYFLSNRNVMNRFKL